MTYRIEITADTISELAGKVLACAAQFQTVPATEDVKPKATRRKNEARSEPQPEEVLVNTKEVSEPEQAKAPEKESEKEVRKAPALDFDKDVAPLVLRARQKLGRESMIDIFDQFGVSRASELESERWPELVNILNDAMGV